MEGRGGKWESKHGRGNEERERSSRRMSEKENKGGRIRSEVKMNESK